MALNARITTALGAWLLAHAALASAAELDARLEWARRAALSTPVSGKVQMVAVEVGDRVEKGAALVRLDPRPFEYALRKWKATVASRQEARDEAERERDRAQQLYDRTLLSTHELQLAEIALVKAEAELERARAERDQAALDLEHSVVRAPFDAVVVGRDLEVGQTVVTRLQSTPLVVVAEAGRMIARVLVAEDALTFEPGATATVSVGGRQHEGRVRRIELEPVEERAGAPRYGVDVEFPVAPDARLRAGQTAKVMLP